MVPDVFKYAGFQKHRSWQMSRSVRYLIISASIHFMNNVTMSQSADFWCFQGAAPTTAVSGTQNFSWRRNLHLQYGNFRWFFSVYHCNVHEFLLLLFDILLNFPSYLLHYNDDLHFFSSEPCTTIIIRFHTHYRWFLVSVYDVYHIGCLLEVYISYCIKSSCLSYLS